MWILWVVAIVLWCVNLGGAIWRKDSGCTPGWGEVIRGDILIIMLQICLLLHSV